MDLSPSSEAVVNTTTCRPSATSASEPPCSRADFRQHPHNPSPCSLHRRNRLLRRPARRDRVLHDHHLVSGPEISFDLLSRSVRLCLLLQHGARRAGGFVPADRELPRVPSRDQRFGADQPRRRTGAQVRSSNRLSLPCHIARASRRRLPGWGLEEGHEIVAPHGAARDRRAVPAAARRWTFVLRGFERVLRGGAARGAALRGVARGRDRRREPAGSGCRLAGSRRRARDAASTAAGDLRETMSDYLVRELDRYGVAVRDRSEVAALHGDNGQLDAVTLKTGERLTLSFLFLFLGALPLHGLARRRRRPRRRRLHPHGRCRRR